MIESILRYIFIPIMSLLIVLGVSFKVFSLYKFKAYEGYEFLLSCLLVSIFCIVVALFLTSL